MQQKTERKKYDKTPTVMMLILREQHFAEGTTQIHQTLNVVIRNKSNVSKTYREKFCQSVRIESYLIRSFLKPFHDNGQVNSFCRQLSTRSTMDAHRKSAEENQLERFCQHGKKQNDVNAYCILLLWKTTLLTS